ncbi:hypothetical protein FRC09_011864 [Ceratobasidium sp. 395]|nr:hypothetical protein FRC09_011864 [Ceratobasidium sp. 395]
MRSTLGERNKVDQHWLALNGHYGGMEAHYAAYEAMVEAELQNEALDLAISQHARKASLDQAQISVSRKGSAVDALALPEFTILGATPISAAQDMPSSPHAPFEWDNLEPFGPTSGTSHRPASVEDRQSTYRKTSQPELEIELARKPRPATIQNEVRVDDDAASVNTSKGCSGPGGRKRLGVILDGQAVSDEIEKRYGGGRL